MRKVYPAVLYQHEDVFEVFLPDFDECVVGLTLEETVEEARRAAGVLVERFCEEGIEVPEPSPVEEILEISVAGVVVLVDLEA